MRHIQKADLADKIFIPTSFDNRLDPEPVMVFYRLPTKKTLRLIRSAVADFIRDGKDPTKSEEANLQIQHLWLALHIMRIENYGDIEDAKAFVEHGEDRLVHEVCAELVRASGLGQAEKKTSNGSAVSSSATTRASNGDAKPDASTSEAASAT